MFICSDAVDKDDNVIKGSSIAEIRLEHGYWPFYKNTLYKSVIRPGDFCVIYIAGSIKSARCFVATAKIDEVVERNELDIDVICLEGINKKSDLVAKLGETSYFEKPVKVYEVIDHISIFNQNRRYWGLSVQGGCRKLTESDFKIIVEFSTRSL
jgi:hypothetical protein